MNIEEMPTGELRISATLAELVELRSRDRGFLDSDNAMYEILSDSIHRAGYEWGNPSVFGDLTEAPMVFLMGIETKNFPRKESIPGIWPLDGTGYVLSSSDTEKFVGTKVEKRWGWMRYAIDSLLGTIADEGHADLEPPRG